MDGPWVFQKIFRLSARIRYCPLVSSVPGVMTAVEFVLGNVRLVWRRAHDDRSNVKFVAVLRISMYPPLATPGHDMISFITTTSCVAINGPVYSTVKVCVQALN